MPDPAVILFANDAFYLAFNTRDINVMERLWAQQTSPVCIHPGWGPMFDREEIITSWRDIFSGGDGEFKIECHAPVVVPQGGLYSVVCYEELAGGWLSATNTFVIEEGEPRICFHQASPCANPPDEIPDTPRSIQ